MVWGEDASSNAVMLFQSVEDRKGLSRKVSGKRQIQKGDFSEIRSAAEARF
jgi:hypothetical protein